MRTPTAVRRSARAAGRRLRAASVDSVPDVAAAAAAGITPGGATAFGRFALAVDSSSVGIGRGGVRSVPVRTVTLLGVLAPSVVVAWVGVLAFADAIVVAFTGGSGFVVSVVTRSVSSFQPFDALFESLDGSERGVRARFDRFVGRPDLADVAPHRLEAGVEFGDALREVVDALCEFIPRLRELRVGVSVRDGAFDGSQSFVQGVCVCHGRASPRDPC